jgi:hypothetical protein
MDLKCKLEDHEEDSNVEDNEVKGELQEEQEASTGGEEVEPGTTTSCRKQQGYPQINWA